MWCLEQPSPHTKRKLQNLKKLKNYDSDSDSSLKIDVENNDMDSLDFSPPKINSPKKQPKTIINSLPKTYLINNISATPTPNPQPHQTQNPYNFH